MKKIITVALLCAPLALHAAYFTQETVSFDKDGKPNIQAQLILPPINVLANVHYSPFSLFDDDEPIAKPTLIAPSIQRPTPEMIAQENIAQAAKEQVAAETVATAAKLKLENEKAKFIALKRAQEKLKIAQAKKAAEIAAEIKRNASTHTLATGQTYSNALRTWLAPLQTVSNKTQTAYRSILWQLSPDTLDKLNKMEAKPMTFNRDLTQAIVELGKHIDAPLTLTLNKQDRVGALSDEPVGVYWIQGDTLKAAIKKLTLEFNWQWLEEDNLQSWLAPNDYPFTAAYPLIVRGDSFENALDSVIAGYPLQGKLLHGPRTVFITEK